jgi:cation:H+ antiporter
MLTTLRTARGGSQVATRTAGHTGKHIAVTAIGIALLVAGAELMVRGAVSLATRMGVSEAVIGLTLVALGTSLPELATSVVAAIKGHAELSVGNILGSNIFNLGLIVGTAFTLRPNQVPAFVVLQDLPFLVLMTVLVGLGILRDGRITRAEGGLMLGAFFGYMVFLVLRGV